MASHALEWGRRERRIGSVVRLVASAIVALALPGFAAHAQRAAAERSDSAPRSGTGEETIIVSGASGHLGELTVEALLDRGVPASRLILVSRTPEKLAKYAQMGASTRFGDFTKPESLPAAYAGGTRMLLISVGGTKTEPAPVLIGRAIDAAKADGVKHIVYTSYIGISRGDHSDLIASNHQAAEDLLKRSGVAWTMLRNSIYMDGLVAQAAKMIADGRAVAPPNESPIGYVTREDCALAAAAALATPGHENKAYDITGPQLLGVREIAAAASAVTGKPIEVVQGGADAKPGFGRPAMAFTSMDFERLTGRAPTSVRALFDAEKSALVGAPH
ncbi:MAG TPA: NAD(P)H-binding protein [Gammaproteobacteria bacterium]|nr:NAD(P)H-binding protein [Gammaproteobacteria bacterium]